MVIATYNVLSGFNWKLFEFLYFFITNSFTYIAMSVDIVLGVKMQTDTSQAEDKSNV